MTILDKQEITKKVIFSAYGKSLAEKHVLFFNQNRGRYKILVETKKFRLDGTILKKKEKFEKSHFFGLRKIISQKTRFS